MLGQEVVKTTTVDRSTPAGRPTSTGPEITRDHGMGLKPEDQKLYDKAIKKAGALWSQRDVVLMILRAGKAPFHVFTQAGRKWGKYYNEKTKTLTVKPVPPAKSWMDIAKDVAKMTGVGLVTQAAVKYGREALDAACKVTSNPTVQMGAKIAGSTPNPYAQGASAGVDVMNAICGAKAGAQAPPPRIAFYHKSQKLWHVYAPQGGDLSGFVAPAGYLFQETAATKPADATDGGEFDDPIYKKWWFWTGLGGVVAAGAGGVVWWRRRRRG